MFAKRTTSPTETPTQTTALADDSASEFVPLWQPAQAPRRKSVEQLLLERGQVTAEQLAQAKTVQSQTPGKSLAQILLGMNAASEVQILSALAETLGLGYE